MIIRQAFLILLTIFCFALNSFSEVVESVPPSETQVIKNEPVDYKPVFFMGDFLFKVTESSGLSANERASIITNRINEINKRHLIMNNPVKVQELQGMTGVYINKTLIITVNDEEAALQNKSRNVIARMYANKLELFVSNFKTENSLGVIMWSIGYTVIATLFFILFYFLNNYLNKKFTNLVISENFRNKIPKIKIQELELVNPAKLIDYIPGFMNIIRLSVILLLVYFYASVVFSFFPWTQGYSSYLLSHITEPIIDSLKNVADYIPNLFFIIITVFIAYQFNRFIKFIFNAIHNGSLKIKGFDSEWTDTTYKMVLFLNLVFVIIIIFPYLPGSKSPAFQGVSVFVGLLISFGSSSAISNIVAGVVLTYTNAFKLGDRVEIAGAIGDVVDKTLLVTKIKTIKNVEITIPNTMVLNSHVINYTSACDDNQKLILHTTITIGYDVPWKEVHSALLKSAFMTENILKSPEPFVLQKALDDYYVHYEINAYTEKPNIMARIYSDLYQNIQDCFNEAGIEIMSPHYYTLRDGNMTTIPQKYLPEDYKQPPFNIRST